MMGDTIVMPRSIPDQIAQVNDHGIMPAPQVPAGLGVEGGTGQFGARNGVLNGFGVGVSPMAPPASAPVARPPRISHIMEGNLIFRVQPTYPALARQARIQGSVVLRAIISRDGRIENLQLIDGHPMLVQSAMEAVRQWRYRPYILNDEPVEVETVVTVNFILGK